MKKFTIAAALGATILAGTAIAAPTPALQQQPAAAQQAPGPKKQRMAMPTTREEAIQRADAMFDRLDVDRNGIVTPAEREAARKARAEQREARGKRGGEHAGKRGGGPRGERMGQRQGANRDANVTRDEFRARALQRFDRIDTNRDGRIDDAELTAAREAIKARWAERRATRAPQAQ